jgi:YD repeat-containing protein
MTTPADSRSSATAPAELTRSRCRCIESAGVNACKRTRFVNEPGRTTRVISGLGFETPSQYDRRGRLVRSVCPDGSARGSEYDAENRITHLVDARGPVWRARYSYYGDCVLGFTAVNGRRL